MSVLVIEDQLLLRDILVTNLQLEGHQVYEFESAEQFMQSEIDLNDVQIAILDITLPGMSGLALSAALRKRHPGLMIIILTMHNELDAKFKSLEAGANLYLTKPVDPKALSQAVKQLRTVEKTPRFIAKPADDIVLNAIKLRLQNAERIEKLSFKEVKILSALKKSSVPVVEHWQLLEALGMELDEQGKKHLEVTLSRLRQKLKNLTHNPKQETILSVRGVGYSLVIEIKLIES
ncbi:response regulator transcription factor [Thiomicrospira microaerophila]|uniref:response regulator transcription factor n=1 Tax=Thiomicrospira microaerophila TaxID=406020 RepID=UPI0005C95E46|nr:response regulator transcription factor [Thiomicrospira microaerophila]